MSLKREATKAPLPPSIKVSKRTETGLSSGSHTRGGETALQRPQEGSGTRTPPLSARPRSGCVFTRCPPPADRKLFSIAPTTDPSLSARVHYCTDAPRRPASTSSTQASHSPHRTVGKPLPPPAAPSCAVLASVVTDHTSSCRADLRCRCAGLLPPAHAGLYYQLHAPRLAGRTTAYTPAPASSALLPALAASRSPPPRRLLRPSNPAAAASDPAVEGRIRPQAMPET